jgi:lysine-specific histone demethylase 1
MYTFEVYLIVVALMAGDAAFQAEEESDESLIQEMTTLLSRIHHEEQLPPPVQAIVSRWGKDPFALGSYSFVGPEATGEDYDILGERVRDKIYFAGEATCRTHPATVHGAYMSGLRAANEVLESFIGKIEMPPEDVLIPKKNHPVRNPLMDRSSIPDVRRRTDPESHRYKARNIKRARFSKIVEECSERILSELGSKPYPPKKYHPNAFLLFQKDKWEIAKEKAKQRFAERDDSTETVTRDDVRASMGRMWRDLPEGEKQLYLERVESEKAMYKEEMSTFSGRLLAWEENVARIKEEAKKKLGEVELTEEERVLIDAAREEERLEVAAREEKENLRKFYGEVGMESLISEDEEDQTEVRTASSVANSRTFICKLTMLCWIKCYGDWVRVYRGVFSFL